MKVPFYLVLIAVIIAAGVAISEPSKEGKTVFDSGLEERLRAFVEEFNAEEHRITLQDYEGPVEITSCESLIKRAKSKPFHFSGLSPKDLSDLTPCMFWAMLREAEPASRSFFPVDDQLGQTIYTDLDLTTFRSSFGRRVPRTDKDNTLAGFYSNEAIISDRTIKIDSDHWCYKLEVSARADFDGDGVEDLLVSFVDDAKEGTYFVIKPLVLSRTEVDGPIAASSWDEILRLEK